MTRAMSDGIGKTVGIGWAGVYFGTGEARLGWLTSQFVANNQKSSLSTEQKWRLD